MTLSPQWLDQLRDRTALSKLIGRTVKLQKAGREYKACCPFHNEKTPSFTVNDEKGFYHCFGCGAHGDAISWMTEQRGLGFMDAVKELAASANMEVPAPDPKAAARQERRATWHDVMAAAERAFADALAGVAGARAREYLANRGIDGALIERFGLGFAPDRRDAIAKALSDFDEAQLIECGLLIAVDDRAPYDRFRGRVMIPIRDARGRTIAFGGRLLDAGEPKYLNSPDTPLFDKGRTLYNLDVAATAARQRDRLIVVEGYMDVIACARAGIDNAVAPLGTALTEEQIERAWKLADTPTLCFDGDAAGQRAARRAVERVLPILRPGKSLAIVSLPAGQDPDDLLQSAGKQSLVETLDRSAPLHAFLWHQLRREAGANPGPDARAALLAELEQTADRIAHRQLASEYRRTFRQLFYDSFGFRGKAAGGGVVPTPATARRDRHSLVFEALLTGLARYPELIHERFEQLLAISVGDEELAALRDDLLHAAMEGNTIALDRLSGNRGNQLGYAFLSPATPADDARAELMMLIDAIVAEQENITSASANAAAIGDEMTAEQFERYRIRIVARNAARQKLQDRLDDDRGP